MSTAVVYGLRPWSLRVTWLTCAVVTVVTGRAAAHARRSRRHRLGGDQRDPAHGAALPGHGLARSPADGGDGRGAPDGGGANAGPASPASVRPARLARAAYADHGGPWLHGAAPRERRQMEKPATTSRSSSRSWTSSKAPWRDCYGWPAPRTRRWTWSRSTWLSCCARRPGGGRGPPPAVARGRLPRPAGAGRPGTAGGRVDSAVGERGPSHR